MKTQRRDAATTLVAAASTFTLAVTASAANIGFVAGLSGGALDKTFDIAWAERLVSQGHTVTPIDQSTSSNSPIVAGMDLLIVSQDVGSGTYLGGVGIDQPKPILTYEYGLYDDIFGTSGNGATSFNPVSIMISDPSHPLAAGLSGNVTVYNGTANLSRFTASSVSSGTQIIAVNAADPTMGIFAVLEAGAIGASGKTWPALRMTLPCYDTWPDPTEVTPDGWRLLDNAVNYALASVPEPGSVALLGLGMAFFLVWRQRR